MEIATVSFDTRTRLNPRGVVFLGALVLVVIVLIVLFSNGAPLFLVVATAAVGSALAIVWWILRPGPTTNNYRYLWIDSAGVHFRPHPTVPEEYFAWERIRSVKQFWEEALVGLELQVSTPAGWPQSRVISVPYRDDLEQAFLLIQRMIDAHSHSQRARA